MTEVRCPKCRRLLMKAEHVHAEVKCPKCGHISDVTVFPATVSSSTAELIYIQRQ